MKTYRSQIEDAIRDGDTETVITLLPRAIQAKEFTIDSPDAKGQTLAHLAASHGQIKILVTLVDELKADVNVLDHASNSPIHACLSASLSISDKVLILKYLLLDKNADPLLGKTIMTAGESFSTLIKDPLANEEPLKSEIIKLRTCLIDSVRKKKQEQQVVALARPVPIPGPVSADPASSDSNKSTIPLSKNSQSLLVNLDNSIDKSKLDNEAKLVQQQPTSTALESGHNKRPSS